MGPRIFLGLLAALNLWLTARVCLAGPQLAHKSKLVLSIWLIPVFGAFVAVNHIRFHAPDPTSWLLRSRRTQPEGPDAEAPDEVHPPGLAPFPLRDHLLPIEGGTPQLDWSAVNRWLEPLHDMDVQVQARQACQRAWLLHVRDALGPGYRLLTYPDVSILASIDAAEATSAFFTHVHGRIAESLRSLAPPRTWGGNSILIITDNQGDWEAHLGGGGDGPPAYHGQHAVFIDSGCPHFVVDRNDMGSLEPMVAHELTRQALSYLHLPEWLATGIAVNTTSQITGAPLQEMSPQQMRHLHRQYWDEDSIQAFWLGQAFDGEEESVLAFDLARQLTEQISQDWTPFAHFVSQASRDDAGAEAARRHLGIDLGAAVCAVLGKITSPAWQPCAHQIPRPWTSG